MIRAYHGACTGGVERWGGYVAKYMGDGVLAYFGWPQAHEDEAERAVRAGLDLVAAVAGLATPDDASLAARVGIATGRVVVGELIGAGTAQEEAVVGETPNLAARLQALAPPGSVVISQATRRLVGGLFELADLGPRRLKGFAGAMAAWRVIGPSVAEGRFEALHGERLTPLVGREHELGILLERWAWARDGEGQVVLLAGEAGIGKSRITQALLEALAAELYTRLRYFGSPYHTNSALHPVIAQLERAAGFHADDGAEARLDKLDAVLGGASERVSAVAPLLAALLSLPSEGRYQPLNLTPQAQKTRTLEALLGQLEGLAARQPVLMVLEDAHWIDPTTIEFEQIIDRVERLPVLLLITFRPDFTPPWAGHAHTTTLALNRLGRHQGAAIVERLTGGKALPAEVHDQILAKTDGVPLFVEELTKTVLESGLLEEQSERYVLTGPLTSLAIPSTLHDSLMTRLDRLAPFKEVAQMGAVIGREFAYDLLAAVSLLPEDELTGALDALIAAELIFRRGTPPEASYTFKHALVQDAAYESLLKGTRQRIHQRIARTLKEQFPATTETQPELLAYHYTEAQLTEQAIDSWQRAGQRASKRSATVEAIAQLSKALELLESLPRSVERDRKELDLRVDLTTPLIASKGMAAPELGHTITRARGLCEQLGETTRIFPVLYGQWVFRHVSGQVSKGLEFAKEAARLAEGESSEIPRMVAHRTLAIALIGLGDPAAARQHLQDGNKLYDGERHRDLALVYGMDFFEVNLAYLALTDWFLGFPDRVLKANEETIRFARSLSHANSLCHALCFGAATLHTFNRQFASAREIGEELIRVASAHDMPQWSLFGRMFVSIGLLEAEENEEGTRMLEACLEQCRAVPMLANSTLALARLAESQARKGEYENALKSIAEADGIIEAGGERWARSEIVRLKGEILRAQSASADAESCFRRAVEVAQHQGAKLLQLRATVSLARLWQTQGRFREARELLAPFTTGSPRASTPPTSKRPKRWSTSSVDFACS